jgi:TrpR-related protein YerC/YecD
MVNCMHRVNMLPCEYMKRDTFREAPTTDTPSSYPTRPMKDLFEAVLSLKDHHEAAKFFRDLLTVAELTEFANRWQMVKLLVEGKPYTTIAAELKTSTATVTRVAHWLFQGMGGYQLAADRVLPKKNKKAAGKPFKLRGK